MHPARNLSTTAGIALVAALALTGCDGSADDSQAADPTSPSTPTSTPSPVSGPQSMEGVDGALEAGSWAVPLYAKDYLTLPRAVVEVPEGYGSPGGWTVDRGADGDPGNYGAVDFWSVGTVVDDPCNPSINTDPGPTVRDLADALHQQSGRRATEPEPVTLDGHHGLYLEITAPQRFDACDNSTYTLWHSDDDFPNATNIPSTVFRIWILDVDGTRILVNETTTPNETKADKAEVLAIAESTHFIDPVDPAA